MRRTSAGQSLVLASSSPRRRQLLLSIGVDFTIRVPDVDEARLAGEAAEAYVRRLSAAKAAAIEAERSLVLAADTIVVLEGDVLGKPDSDDEARRMLARLAGREHTVLTGVTLRDTDAGTSVSDIAASGVRLRQLSAGRDRVVRGYRRALRQGWGLRSPRHRRPLRRGDLRPELQRDRLTAASRLSALRENWE